MTRPMLALAVMLAGCLESTPPPASAHAPPPALVTFHALPGDAVVQVEVAATPAARTKGLMYRQSLATNAGMVFVFANEEVLSFWMKNTYVALDMIFLSANKTVVGVVAHAEPLTETPRGVDAPAQYVVEVNASYAQEHGIVAGTVATFENIPESVTR